MHFQKLLHPLCAENAPPLEILLKLGFFLALYIAELFNYGKSEFEKGSVKFNYSVCAIIISENRDPNDAQ